MRINLANKIIKFYNPDLLLLGCDNAYFSIYLVRQAKKHKIPIVTLPFSLCNHEEVLFAISRTNQIFALNISNLINKISSIFYPKWYKLFNNIIHKFPAEPHLLIQEILALSPRDPWIICGGNSNYVFVNSDFEKNYYINASIPLNKLVLYSITKEKHNVFLYKKNRKPIILWSIPPDHLNNNNFNSFEEMIKYHFDIFKSLNLEIIVSPHPRINKQYLNKFTTPENVRISYNKIVDLIYECDYFIASQSATIRFALFCNKYILNFKIYLLPYSEYDNFPMIKNIYNKDEFLSSLYLLKEDKLFNGNEYNNFPNNYFESDQQDINKCIMDIIKNKK